MFRGGTSSLPITSPNLSFREFLDKMNTAQQIQRAEHDLNKIEGSTVVASKKKRKTFATASREASEHSTANYVLPECYDTFRIQLQDACTQGDLDARQAIERLAPHMATTLKSLENGKQWESPDVPLDDVPAGIQIVTSVEGVHPPEPDFLDKLIMKELGQFRQPPRETQAAVSCEPNEALANFLLDVSLAPDTTPAGSLPSKGKLTTVQGEEMTVSTLLKGLQPQREVPSKDRGRRFAAGRLAADRPLHVAGNEVE